MVIGDGAWSWYVVVVMVRDGVFLFFFGSGI